MSYSARVPSSPSPPAYRSSFCFVNPHRIFFAASLRNRNAMLRGVYPSAMVARFFRHNINRFWWTRGTLDSRVLQYASSSQPTSTTLPTIEIPVSGYQLIGVSDTAEKDEIVKKVMQLKKLEVDEGYTLEAAVYRQDLLMDIRDKLLFEPEYAGNVKEKTRPKSALRIPLPWLPGALCLLQEVGEEERVLKVGQAALRLPDITPFLHDVLLSMALAECANAKIGFENNKVSAGFEALARAQTYLRSKTSLEMLPLLSEIEDSLGELAPACTLDILSLPHTQENSERKQGAVAALKEFLRRGFEAETPNKIQDWPSFVDQAFEKLTAGEIVELLPWTELATVRKNKKSIESQNQRVVIDFSCFYRVLIAHIAVGFSHKQNDTIHKAKIICECLMASEGVDLKLEESFCLFLLGEGSENEAYQRLKQVMSNSNPNPAAQNLLNLSGGKITLEGWVRDSILAQFSDTRDSSSSLASFFHGEKKHAGIRKSTVSVPSNWPTLKRVNTGDSNKSESSSQSIPPNVDQNQRNASETSKQLKRSLVPPNNEQTWKSHLIYFNIIGRISAAVTMVACVGVFAWKYKLFASKLPSGNISIAAETTATSKELNAIKKLSQMLNLNLLKDRIISHSIKQMPIEEAEALVRKWQAMKAQSLGPNYHLDSLEELLDESMLHQWTSLADEAKARSCYWRFVLLKLSILRAEIFFDKFGNEVAQIDALIEEAAELVDDSLSDTQNYYSSYRVHYVLKKQKDGSWKFCKGDIQTPS